MREQRSDFDVPAQVREQDDLRPAERSLRARLAAYAMHARHDARRTTANGRAAFLARFEHEVDPDGRLDPEERRRRADHARSLYFARLSLAAAKSRRTKRQRQGGEGQ
jgi:hypothetical protein